MIKIELMQNFPAWARLYAKMAREFGREYEGTMQWKDHTSKQQEKLAVNDIQKQYTFWIIKDNKKIGYVCAPTITDPDGKIRGRYIDTRYIQKKYRAQGIGQQVLNILEQEHGIEEVKINTLHLKQNGKWWADRGYSHAIMACLVDQNFDEERILFKMKKDDYAHWYMLKDEGYAFKLYADNKAPMLDLNKLFYKEAA